LRKAARIVVVDHAILIERCHTDQDGDLLAVQRAQFWQVRKQCQRRRRPDTRNASQHVVLFHAIWMPINCFPEVPQSLIIQPVSLRLLGVMAAPTYQDSPPPLGFAADALDIGQSTLLFGYLTCPSEHSKK